MSGTHYRPPSRNDIDNPTCSFTGERLVGTISVHDGGRHGVDCQEVPMAYAEYYRRHHSANDTIPHAPGMTVTPLYRASLPQDELEAAQDILFIEREEMTSEDWQVLCDLIQSGWVVQWAPNARSEFATDDWCEPIKPFGD
jgi:hypothetical protein